MFSESLKCIFCKILKGDEPNAIIFENKVVTCIKDIKPASTHHYLILPNCHIKDAKALQGPEHEKIFDKMVNVTGMTCDRLALDVNETRTGFHWPSFTTINHLHLHVISPVKDMGLVGRYGFCENSMWFTSVDYVKSRFRSDDS